MKNHRLAQSNSTKSHSKLFHYKKLLQIYRFTFNSANLQRLFSGNTLQLYRNFYFPFCHSVKRGNGDFVLSGAVF